MWIVDPVQRTVTIHRSGTDPVLLTEDNTLTEEGLLPGFTLSIREIFPAT